MNTSTYLTATVSQLDAGLPQGVRRLDECPCILLCLGPGDSALSRDSGRGMGQQDLLTSLANWQLGVSSPHRSVSLPMLPT